MSTRVRLLPPLVEDPSLNSVPRCFHAAHATDFLNKQRTEFSSSVAARQAHIRHWEPQACVLVTVRRAASRRTSCSPEHRRKLVRERRRVQMQGVDDGTGESARPARSSRGGRATSQRNVAWPAGARVNGRDLALLMLMLSVRLKSLVTSTRPPRRPSVAWCVDTGVASRSQ